jgi:HD-GYP domain-containing protein (c-di-GMP phosphodiesterase class II)
MLIAVASGSGKIDVFFVKNIVSDIINIFDRDRSLMVNMANTSYAKNDYIYKHSLNVAILSINIALAYGYNKNQITDIAMGALLADVGMLLISHKILNKEGPLDSEEMGEVYKHPL